MKDTQIAMNPNKIVRYLLKSSEEFTKQDLIKFIEGNNIEMVNFRYVGGDGRLKTLNFVITSKAHLDQLLSTGERVDGSSLFSYVDAGSSDLYVIPRYKTAYVNPFSTIPAVDILCAYYTNEGVPLPSAPEHIVAQAHKSLKDNTGLTLEGMGELEYYVLYDSEGCYPMTAQRGYHGSSPFSKWEHLRCEAMQAIAQAGGKIKYGHSEVGHICGEDEEQEMEQHEIEFLSVPIEDAADQLVIAKWILRVLGHKYGVTVTFAPKILVGHAGSGLHIHTRLVQDGKNMMVDEGGLTDTAKKVIAGYLSLAPSLSAFGNTIPVSYLRLVPHQEAPTNICWGDRNRSALVRVPLGWQNVQDMIRNANPREGGQTPGFTGKSQDAPACDRGEMGLFPGRAGNSFAVPLELPQAGDLGAAAPKGFFTNSQTVEFRCPDGSANVYLLLAGLAVAARHGLEMKDALELAAELYVDVNIFSPEHKEIQERLPKLPVSCWESADMLLKDRQIYERDNVFSPAVIDGLAEELESYDDKDLSERLYLRKEEIKKLVEEYLHCA